MPVRIGINGFGRIGRYLIRLLANCRDVEIGCINARASNSSLAHLLKYDSCHGHFPYPVSYDESSLTVNGKIIPITRQTSGTWLWRDYNIDIAAETTGTIKDEKGLAQHLACGAKKVVVSAPCPGVDATIVMGVNHEEYQRDFTMISGASCTTNCMALPAMVLDQNFGIKHGLMTTVHSYTMSQRILDGSHKDLRRARAAAVSMIPTTTGAARTVGLVYPPLNGKLDGMAVRVPTPTGSLVDLVCEMNRDVDIAGVNAALKAAAQGPLKENMGYSEEPLVSVDYIGSTYGGVIDALSTNVIGKRMVKLIIWYDNEAGFTNQYARLLRMVARSM